MNIAVNTRMLIKCRMEGIGRYSYETATRLASHHPEHQFYFFFDRQTDTNWEFPKNVQSIVLFPPARHPLLWYWWFEHSIRKAFKKYSIDVFYSPDGYLCLHTKVPTVLVSHDVAYLHFPNHLPGSVLKYYKYFVPKFHRRANRIVAVSRTTKEDIVEKFQLDPSKVSIAYNGCTDQFKVLTEKEKAEIRLEYSNGKPFFIYLGSFHPRKNISNTIRAFNLYCRQHKDDMQLLLVGRWAWKNSEAKRVLSESPVRDNIHVYDGNHSNIPALLGAAECLVYASLWEGFGLPVLEAMHCEIPVISSVNTSMEEVAEGAAILINPHNVSDIANAMWKSRNHEIRQKLIHNAGTRRQRFSWETTAEEIYKCLREVADHPV